MKKEILTISIGKATYELIKNQAILEDRSMRSWLDKFFKESFPHEISDIEHDILLSK